MAEEARAVAPAPAGTRPGPLMEVPTQENTTWSRRNFLGLGGWAMIGAVVSLWGLAFMRFMFPRVLFEPATAFKGGQPGDYTIGEVSERFKDKYRVWIVREADHFYALLAICTHLGCTPRWLPLENKFKCPCHGSGFKKDGVNFEGPAPRPLERVLVSVAPDGQLLIDNAIRFRKEKNEWGKPGSRLGT